jgi:hypothetical protein
MHFHLRESCAAFVGVDFSSFQCKSISDAIKPPRAGMHFVRSLTLAALSH